MNPDRTLEVTLFRSVVDVDGARASLSWAELSSALSGPVICPGKSDAPGWSPACFEDDERGAPVERVACLVYDVDGPLPPLTGEVAWFAHTTHSHRVDSPRWRVVVLTDRPHTAAEHEPLWRTVAAALGIEPDGQTIDAGRFYWGPSAPTRDAFETRRSDGRPLPVGSALAVSWETTENRVVSLTPPRGLPAATSSSGEGGPKNVEILGVSPEIFGPAPIDLDTLRGRVKTLRHGKTRVALETLLNFGPLPQKGGRNAWMHAAFSAVGAMGWTPGVAEYLATTFANRLELDAGETVEEWKRLALFSYQRAAEQRAHRDSLTTTFAKVLGAAPSDDWRQRLITFTKNDTIKVDSNGFNVQLILSHDEAFKTLRWNTLTCDVEVTDGPFLSAPRGTLDVAVTDWLYATPEYRIRLAREEVAARLVAVARSRPYDPVREYLEGLEWDGVPRLDTFLQTYCAVSYGESRYAGRVGRRFLVGAVARAYKPGCQMDTILLLQGPQGVGKTSLVRALGGPFMAELHMDPGNKDTLQAIAGRWFIELSELASARRTDAETMRAFITRRVDVLRLPYGRVTEEFPRRCVFVGTTNEDHPLTDQHGNRRYWPVTVGRIDTHGLQRDRDQLFAEAVVAYKSGERWWLDPEEQLEADDEAQNYTETDTWAEMIREWYRKLAPEQRPREVSVALIALKVLRLEPNQLTRTVTIRISFALRSLRFVRLGVKSRKDVVMYEAPQELFEEVRV